VTTAMLPKMESGAIFLASIIVRQSQCKATPGEVLVPIHGQAPVEGHHGFHSPAGANATRAPTPQGHKRHGGSGPQTTAMGAQSRAGTNATGAQGHWLLPRGAQDLVLQPGNLYILEDSSSPVYLGVPGPPFFLPGQVTAEATLRESQTASQTASMALIE
jgi:hypothetical protein